MSGKRSASDAVGEPESSETSKRCRLRSAVDESLTHLVCAITQELPLDPVTAEDGNIYERSAIEEWLSRYLWYQLILLLQHDILKNCHRCLTGIGLGYILLRNWLRTLIAMKLIHTSKVSKRK